jgi:tRNA modification GTPase
VEDDTIVACSTPPGRGALGVVRVSGPASRSILTSLCPDVTGWIDRRATHATVKGPRGEPIDDSVVTCFTCPHSYSGEDMVEVSCHGSPIVLDRVVDAILAAGARGARPGEFTLRAFLNGRVDLAQAEAVVDLVDARTDAGMGLALRQLEGELSRRVEPLRSEILDLLAHITALVDFSEEDVPSMQGGEARERLHAAAAHIARLLEGSTQGQVLSHGVSLAIIGAPNSGKSSILNGLLGRQRAIVTPIAGTTRDTLEEDLSLGDVLFRIADTAGMTYTDDPVESIGVQRSRSAAEAADVILVVIDRGQAISPQDRAALALARDLSAGRSVVVALNKSDLTPMVSPTDIASELPGVAVVSTCAVTAEGLEGLRGLLPRLALGGPAPDGFVVSNRRHVQSLRDAAVAVDRAVAGLGQGLPLDLAGLDVRQAAASLGEILGVEVGDEVLDRVFSRFCIGK